MRVHVTADDLIDTLRGNGYRVTEARRAVCAVIADSHDEHLSAADIYRRSRGVTGRRVDRATVYRALEALEESGLLTHSHLGHGPSVYHLADMSDHQHLVCRSCGRTLTIPDGETRRFAAAIHSTTGFLPDLSHFALSGICPGCAG